MATQFICGKQLRRELTRDHSTLNGIDYLEVLDLDAPAFIRRQRTLLVHFLKPAPALTDANVEIEGGVRVTPVKAQWVAPAMAVTDPPAESGEPGFFAGLADAANILVIRTDSDGDFSTYRLRLVATEGAPLNHLDPQLAEVDFSFKVECRSDFDCKSEKVCPPQPFAEPQINYLAKDYASFRRLMLDRMATIMPEWGERNPADLGIALTELLAYVGDHLSYYQDAVATEAYLGTCRKRVSVRRHARLLDYFMHDGCNARTWVCMTVEPGSAADGALLEPVRLGDEHTRFLTGGDPSHPSLAPSEEDAAIAQRPVVFEPMHAVTLRSAHNRIRFYTWSDEECCLPRGATQATLVNDPPLGLNPLGGEVLIFEEVVSPTTGLEADADPAKRHAVRLIRATARTDPLTNAEVIDIEWQGEDALPFPLCLSARVPSGATTVLNTEISVARGNVVLADHGITVPKEDLDPPEVPEQGKYRPRMKQSGIAYGVPFDAEAAVKQSAVRVIAQDPHQALPSHLAIVGAGAQWQIRRDLFGSDRFEAGCVVETAEDGSAWLRFGDGVLGRKPAYGERFTARYRLGNGVAGNIGRETIGRVITSLSGVTRVWNPLPAVGGTDPESMTRVKLDAPYAFRTQERAVTEADWAEVAQRHPEVQRAAARFRWTGSWYTVFVTIDRKGGHPVDAEFRLQMRDYLERYRIAGYDLEINAPLFVPLDILINVCVGPGYFKAHVKRALLEVFSSGAMPDGRRGFFHPDNFSFGASLYLSRIYATAMTVDGVASVEVARFQRWGKPAGTEKDDGVIRAEPLEILQLMNDPNFPENGQLELAMLSGL